VDAEIIKNENTVFELFTVSLFIVWVLGCILFLVFKIRSYLQLRYKILLGHVPFRQIGCPLPEYVNIDTATISR